MKEGETSTESSSTPNAGHAPNRVLILGLDGATFTVLEPLFERGLMPNLAAVAARGVRAVLRSTDPYVTAPAWTSLATGKRPDTHGVFDWGVTTPGSYKRQLVNDLFRRDQAFWEILADRGIPAGSINLPLTYPPSDRASFCIADMFTPSPAVDYTHPRTLKAELEAFGYKIDLRKSDYYQRGFEPYVNDLIDMTRARGRAIRLCLERYPWRAAIAVFVGPDRIQHPFWQHLELAKPWTPETWRAVSFFQALDGEIGQILAQVGPQTHLYVVSDHGFGAHHRAFYVNDWLHANGYLVFKPEPQSVRQLRKLIQGGLRRIGERSRRWIDARAQSQAKIGQGSLEAAHARLEAALSWLGSTVGEGLTPGAPAVDWEKTVAFADTPHGIQINLEGREPRGIVSMGDYDRRREEIATALLKVVDPRTGEAVHREVLPREARYTGTRTDLAPDLVYTFADGSSTWRIGPIDALRFGRRISGTFLATDTAWETGTHRPEGILIAAGPELRGGVTAPAQHLWDIVPTLLYQLEQAIPPDLDGQVMRDLFRPEVLEGREEARGHAPAVRGGREEGRFGDPGEQAAVADHLRSLGYLS